jgi:hypothetical protein
MKKNRLKNYLKLGVLLFGVSLLLTTCEREDTDFIAHSPSEQSVEKGYTVKSVSLEAVKENELIKNSLEVIASQFDFNKVSETPTSKNNGSYTTSALADPIKSKDNSFTILTDEILEVSTDSTKVYTFRIETPTKAESYFENFVIHKKSNDSIDYFIYRYKKIGPAIEQLSMSKERVSSDQINVSDFDDYTQGLVLYDPETDCWFEITEDNGNLIIRIYDCPDYGGLGNGGGFGGFGGYTSGYVFGGTIPNGQFLFGQWIIAGVTQQGNCIINRSLLDMNGSPLRSLEGHLLYESLLVSCPSDSSSNDSSSDDQSWPWDNSSTDSNYDTLHGSSGGGGSSTNTDSSDPNNPDEMVVAVLPPTPLELETIAFFDNLTDEQKDCVNAGFGQLKNDITAYFENSQTLQAIGYDGAVISPQATAFATAAIEAVCSGAAESFDEALEIVISSIIEEEIVDDNLDDCSKGILDELKTLQENDIAKIIQRFGAPDSPYDWEIKTETPTNPNHAAETNWVLDSNGQGTPYDYLTVIDPVYKNQATKIAVARTILHEMIHAYFISVIDDLENNESLTLTIDDIKQLNILWQFIQNEAYEGQEIEIQHEQMASTYITPIKDALKEWNNSSQSNQYYEDLAWGSLTETGTFDYFHPIGSTSRNRIINTNAAEDTNSVQGSISPKGSPCP